MAILMEGEFEEDLLGRLAPRRYHCGGAFSLSMSRQPFLLPALETFPDLAPRSLSQRTAIPQAGPALYSEASMALCQSICKQACGSRLTPATDQWLFAKAHAIQACGSRLTPS